VRKRPLALAKLTKDMQSQGYGLADANTVQELLMWARKQRIAIGEISVGSVRMVVADLALGDDGPKRSDEPAHTRKTLYQEYGGDALEEAKATGTVEPTEEDEDDDR
jgi:hypothetical protein